MTTQFIYKRLRHLEKNRLIGKPGLSMDQVRESETKVRFTENENDLLALVSEKMGECKAVMSNVLLINAVIDLLASEPRIRDEVMREWRAEGRADLDFFSEIEKRSDMAPAIDGEFCHIQPRERRLTLAVNNAAKEEL